MCVFRPRFYELLEFQPQQLSKAQLSRCLVEFLREKHFDICLPEERYIDMTGQTMKELTGLDNDKYILFENGNSIYGWWDLLEHIYLRWKLQ